MPCLQIPFSEIQYAVKLWQESLDEGFPAQAGRGGEMTAAARMAQRLGCEGNLTRAAQSRLDAAVALGLPVSGWRYVSEETAATTQRRYRLYDEEFRAWEGRAKDRPAGASKPRRARPGDTGAAVPPRGGPAPGREPLPSPEPAAPLVERAVPILRRGPQHLASFAHALGVAEDVAEMTLELAQARGLSIAKRGDLWHLDVAPPLGSQKEHAFQLVTDSDGYIEFGACGDQHLCSKYERLDCLNDYYDHAQHRGISIVLSAGNHVDGESSFNRHDITVHGLDPQLQYLAKNYPQRDGVVTWAISGEDHEGWWSRREGVDIGRYTERVMRDAGRTDWVDVGFMECFIPLVHGSTGKSSQLCLMHPGGGSAYAVSYSSQKIVEGFDGGAKPSVLLIGHYHKSVYGLIRNVHTLQTGCFQDQSLFMRQKKLAAHLGGWFCKVHVDPDTGAVDEFTGTFRNYFVKDFYAGRWSEHGPVNHVRRSAKP